MQTMNDIEMLTLSFDGDGMILAIIMLIASFCLGLSVGYGLMAKNFDTLVNLVREKIEEMEGKV